MKRYLISILIAILVLTSGVLASCTTPLIISEVSISSISQSSAVITWQTNKASNSQVEYGTTSQYGLISPLSSELVTNHSVTLGNLQSNTSYHIKVKSKDADGNMAESEDKTFITLADITPPIISGISASQISETGAVITWVTDEPATSQVQYGTSDVYGSTTLLDDSLTTSHSVTLAELKPNTTYHFRVKSKDKAGNEALSGDYTFATSEPAPKVEVQILEHHLVREDYQPPASFSMTFIRGKVMNTGDITLASLDVTIWVQYEVEGLEGRVFNMPGSIDLEPAAFKPGEVRDFEVLVQNGAKEGYEISVSIMPPFIEP